MHQQAVRCNFCPLDLFLRGFHKLLLAYLRIQFRPKVVLKCPGRLGSRFRSFSGSLYLASTGIRTRDVFNHRSIIKPAKHQKLKAHSIVPVLYKEQGIPESILWPKYRTAVLFNGDAVLQIVRLNLRFMVSSMGCKRGFVRPI